MSRDTNTCGVCGGVRRLHNAVNLQACLDRALAELAHAERERDRQGGRADRLRAAIVGMNAAADDAERRKIASAALGQR